MTARSLLRKGWCPGALRPMESGDGLLLRIRPRLGTLRVAALSTIATSRTSDSLANGSTQAAALVDGFHGAFAVGAVIAALGIVATLVLVRRDEVEQVEEVVVEPAFDLAA